MTNRVSRILQRIGQLTCTLAGPSKRRHRIAPRVRVHKAVQFFQYSRIALDQRLAPAPALRERRSGTPGLRCVSSPRPLCILGRLIPRRLSHRSNSMSKRTSFDRRSDPPLPLVEIPKQSRELLFQTFSKLHVSSMEPNRRNVKVISFQAPSRCRKQRRKIRPKWYLFGKTTIFALEPAHGKLLF